MFLCCSDKFIKKVLFALVLILSQFIVTTPYAENQKQKMKCADEKLEVITTITAKKRGYIQASGKVYLLMEMTKLYDITGKTVSMYQIPVPVKAKIIYKNIKDGLPKALIIAVMKDLTPKQRPK